jgi:hypothetical protein
MPEYYDDWWWEDLPPRAVKAAEILGYNKSMWDDDEESEYESKKFEDCTLQERHAAMFLGANPIDEKLDIYWEDTDSETKRHAQALGWDQHKWDHDWAIHDLPCEHLYWKDLSEEQKAAALHFGYSPALWDETDEDDDAEFAALVGSAPPPKKTSSPPKKTSASKPHEESVEEEGDFEEETDAPASKPTKASGGEKKKFVLSRSFGGSGGDAFDHKNNKRITQIKVWSDSHVVNSMEINYGMGSKKAGTSTDGVEQVFKLEKGEYVNEVTVRANQIVQCITFKTSKGNTFGPCGGKGWPKVNLRKDHEGPETTLHAPKGGYQLVGIMGGAGAHLDRIAFRWGPISE